MYYTSQPMCFVHTQTIVVVLAKYFVCDFTKSADSCQIVPGNITSATVRHSCHVIAITIQVQMPWATKAYMYLASLTKGLQLYVRQMQRPFAKIDWTHKTGLEAERPENSVRAVHLPKRTAADCLYLAQTRLGNTYIKCRGMSAYFYSSVINCRQDCHGHQYHMNFSELSIYPAIQVKSPDQ